METYVQLIFILALVKYCLKAALFGKLWLPVGYAAVAAVFSLAIYPFVITQPVTIVAGMLEDRTIVGNMALLSTVEAIAGIFMSVYLLDNYFAPKDKRRKTAFVLKVMPGILVFCAVAYFELLFFKWRVGHDFMGTAVLFAGILLFGISCVSLLLRFVVGGESPKLEVK